MHHLDTAGRDLRGWIRKRSAAAEVQRWPPVAAAQRRHRHHRLRVQAHNGGGVGQAGNTAGGGAGHAPHTAVVVAPTLRGEAVAHGSLRSCRSCCYR